MTIGKHFTMFCCWKFAIFKIKITRPFLSCRLEILHRRSYWPYAKNIAKQEWVFNICDRSANLWNFVAVVLILQRFLLLLLLSSPLLLLSLSSLFLSLNHHHQIPNLLYLVIPTRYHTWYFKNLWFLLLLSSSSLSCDSNEVSHLILQRFMIFFCCCCCCRRHCHCLVTPMRYHTWYFKDLWFLSLLLLSSSSSFKSF